MAVDAKEAERVSLHVSAQLACIAPPHEKAADYDADQETG